MLHLEVSFYIQRWKWKLPLEKHFIENMLLYISHIFPSCPAQMPFEVKYWVFFSSSHTETILPSSSAVTSLQSSSPTAPQRVYDRFQVNSSSSSSSSSTSALQCSGLVLLVTVALLLRSEATLPAQPLCWAAPPPGASPLASTLRKSATALKNSSTATWLQLSLSSSFRSLCPSRVKPQCPPLSVSASRK